MCCMRLTGNAGPKNSPKNRHLGTIPWLCRAISSQLRHISTIGKKLVKQQYLLHVYSQYDELRPTSGWDRFISWGTPANFNGFCALAALLHGTLVLGISQTLRRWAEGATYVWQGGHHVGHWPTFLVPFTSTYYFNSTVVFQMNLVSQFPSGPPSSAVWEENVCGLVGWYFMGRMSFPPPICQCQYTEGNTMNYYINYSKTTKTTYCLSTFRLHVGSLHQDWLPVPVVSM